MNSRKETRKPAKTVRCDLLNGSEWRTEKKYMTRHKGTCDIFFGIEHRTRKEVMEKKFNKEATRQGWRFAAGEARITCDNFGLRS